jgi:hypothetical protein
MQNLTERTHVKVADETFIATALLHRENPDREDFTISEIVERAKKENLFGSLRPGVRVHASLHCVANLAPNPGRYRMLYATGNHTRRLLLLGDDVHPDRKNGKIFPKPDKVPAEYAELIEWAKRQYEKGTSTLVPWLDGVFRLRGMGIQLWQGEDGDVYVRNLREGWQ